MNLTEIVSDTIFHFTYVKNALNIFKTNRFKLVPSIGTSAEDKYSPKNKVYYLSTARSKTGDYTISNAGNNSVVFVLDGTFFNKRYTGKAIDYWDGGISRAMNKAEMEDRIFHSEPYITFKNPNSVIKEIHIYSNDFQYQPLFELIKESKKNKIPVFVYNEKESFILQNKRKSLSLNDIKELFGNPPKKELSRYQRPKRDYFYPYLELMFKNDKDKLSRLAENKLFQINVAGLYREDVIRGLSAYIHNFKKEEIYADQIHTIVKYMRKNSLKTIRELIDHLAEKWNEILQR